MFSIDTVNIVYVLVGISAVWQIMPLLRGFSDGEAHAQHAR